MDRAASLGVFGQPLTASLFLDFHTESVSPDVDAVVRPALGTLRKTQGGCVCVCVRVMDSVFMSFSFPLRRGQTESRGRPRRQSGPAVLVRPPSASFFSDNGHETRNKRRESPQSPI